MKKIKIQAAPKFSRFIYEVRVGGGIKATFCFEQDATDYARQIGGTVYTIGAIR